MNQSSNQTAPRAIDFRAWEHERTLADKAICALLSARFALIEPVRLRLARLLHEREYRDPSEESLISVVMTTFKRPKVLTERCLPAIQRQTYRNFEVVITGDNRIDETSELVRKLNDPRIRYFHVPEWTHYSKEIKSRWYVAGIPSRNRAMALARGKWIAEIDDDDVFLPDHLESLLRFAQKGNHEFVSGAYVVEKRGVKTVVDAKEVRPRIGGVQTWLYRSYLRFFKWNVASWRKHYNRPPDIDRQLRMARAGVRTGFLDRVVTHVLPIPGKETTGLDALTGDRYDLSRPGS
ncbi:MAG: glycosyltransferase family 2 protein [Patescibacteria group bacterium]